MEKGNAQRIVHNSHQHALGLPIAVCGESTKADQRHWSSQASLPSIPCPTLGVMKGRQTLPYPATALGTSSGILPRSTAFPPKKHYSAASIPVDLTSLNNSPLKCSQFHALDRRIAGAWVAVAEGTGGKRIRNQQLPWARGVDNGVIFFSSWKLPSRTCYCFGCRKDKVAAGMSPVEMGSQGAVSSTYCGGSSNLSATASSPCHTILKE